MRLALGLRLTSLVCAVSALQPASQVHACDRARFRIVLDVGHTEAAPGAISARGVTELTFNRRLAAVIAARLAADGFGSVSVIEGQGVGQSELIDRARRADETHPDAYLSLHHDSVQPSYLEPWITDGTLRQHSERFSGFSLFISRGNVDADRSLTLARTIATELLARGLHFTRHHAENIPHENRPWADASKGIYAFDDLFVLKNVHAPAVLLENGVIVNRDEEKLLASDSRRALVARALSAAFGAFCAIGD